MSIDQHRPKGPYIGLDIGSFAVRAAELSMIGTRPRLEHFGQVTLPQGAVVDGEVIDVDAVAAAVKRLWAGGGFSSRRVVVGVSSQRVIVRQAEVMAMSEPEMQSALKFEAADLIPIPVEEALLDFAIVAPESSASPTADSPKMRILLVAAQRAMVNKHLAALKKAGLAPVAVDPLALALLRGMHPDRANEIAESPGSAEVVVSVGADLTTIVVEEDGVARLVRVIGIGGSSLTKIISGEMGIVAEAAEDLKRRAGQDAHDVAAAPVAAVPVTASAGKHVDALVAQVRGSIDFYRTQSKALPVARIMLTGGGAQVAGALPALQAALGPTVELAEPLSAIELGPVGLSAEQIRQAAPYMLAPIGLALWGTAAGRPITLLPDDIRIRRRRNGRIGAAACVVVACAVVVGVSLSAGGARVDRAKAQAGLADAQVAQLTSAVAALNGVSAPQAELTSRAGLYQSALQHDIAWVNLLAQITVVMPHGSYLTTFSGSATPTSTSATSPAVGQVTMSVISPGGYGAVADWLRALSVLPGLSDVVVSGEALIPDKNSIGFSCAATVTAVSQSTRSLHIPGATP